MSILGFLGSAAGQTIAGVGSSLLSNIFGASSTKKTNETNLKINQMNNEFNERMMQKQMDYNTMMWNKQNAYNTPEAMKARGINPYASMMGGNFGSVQALGTSVASAAGSAPQQSFQPNFQGIPEVILMSKQGEMLDAQIDQQLTDNQTRAFKNMQEIADAIATTKNKEIQNKLMQVQLSYADEVQMEQLRNQRATTNKILRETLLLDKNLSIFDERTKLEMAQLSADTLLASASMRLTKQQTIHEIQKMYLTVAHKNGVKLSNEMARRMADDIVEKAHKDNVSTYWNVGANYLGNIVDGFLGFGLGRAGKILDKAKPIKGFGR